MKWYVLFVETGKEILVQEFIKIFLDQYTYYCFIPKKIVSERRGGIIEKIEKIVFPGYVFIYMDITSDYYHKLMKVPRVIRILKSGNYYSCIRDSEMNLILRLTKNNSIIDCSKVYLENSKVNIVDGPLKGMEGTVKKIDKRKRRATIEIEFLNEIRLVNLGIEFVEKNAIK